MINTQSFYKDILKNKKGLITGIVNKYSIASEIATVAKNQGADLAFSYPSLDLKTRVASIADSFGSKLLYHCNVCDAHSVKKTFDALKNQWGNIDFVVHSIAYANKDTLKGKYLDVSLEDFLQAMEISCYSLNLLTKYAAPLMSNGGSILALTYYGATKVMPSYNLMGVAKAALEASVRYLASDVGVDNIRINALSAGPVKTLSASAISGFAKLLSLYASVSPLKRKVVLEDIAKSACYLLSDLSSGVTGETHFVDCGYNIMGAYCG